MVTVSTFYKFIPVNPEALSDLKSRLIADGEKWEIKGLLLIGKEGCNATISGESEKLAEFKAAIQSYPEIGELLFKESAAKKHPFKRFKVDVREEIVTLKDEGVVPSTADNNHLSPAQWQLLLESEEELVVLDTRNFYETELGKFEGAVDLNLNKFSEFPERVKSLGLDKERKVLMYCTGGIRCEKAIIEMQRQGFKNVFQLEGGILKYLEEFPKQKFVGDCFVFDHRVSLDQKLKPTTRYKLCPHCGNPGDQSINCVLCDTPAVVCKRCIVKDELNTCSKNCAHHATRAKAKSVAA